MSGSGQSPEVCVVVPTFDRPERLERLLAALAAQRAPCPFEVVVADDGGRPATLEVLRRWEAGGSPAVRRVAGGGNGPAAARNAAWRLSDAPLVAFTDDDCEPDPGWLAALVATAAELPGGIVQGRTEPNPRDLDAARGIVRTKSIGALGPWYQTCNVLYPRSLLERLGGFDERFGGPFGEDADLGWRAIEAGAPAAFAADAVVLHAAEAMSPGEYLRSALRDPDEALAFRRHAGLRSAAGGVGVFKSRSHALLALALLGLLLARRAPAAALLALPYARLVAARTGDPGHGPQTAPLIVGYDVLETVAAARGAVRHRVAAI